MIILPLIMHLYSSTFIKIESEVKFLDTVSLKIYMNSRTYLGYLRLHLIAIISIKTYQIRIIDKVDYFGKIIR
jgi:hypothetical protein